MGKTKIEEECLKNKIKEQIEKNGGIEKISAMLFTTYDFDTEFFQNQLLPYLFGVSNNANIKDKELFIASKIEEKLEFENSNEGMHLAVCFDHFINDIQANINYHIIPIDKKCLHAKLIILVGEKNNQETATIMVLSGNISISSYSSNQEVCGITETTDKQIIDLVKKISTKEELYELLKMLNKIDELIITGVDEKNKMLEQIENSTKIKVITPFVESSVISRLNSKINLEVLFTNLRGISNKESFKTVLEKSNIKLYTGDRAIHSKIYLIDGDKVIVGSHNLTSKAINSKNIEASIKFQDMSIYRAMNDYYDRLNSNDLTLENYDEEINECPKQEINKNYISNAILDWEEEKIKILFSEEEKKKISSTIYLTAIGNNILNKKIKFNKEYEIKFSEGLKQKLQRSKYFEIESNGEKYYGILYEIQKIDKEIIAGTDTYFDMVEGKLAGNYKKEFDYETSIEIGTEQYDDLDFSYDEPDEIADNFNTLKLFRFYKKINEDIADKNNDKDKIYKTNPNSIKMLLYNFLKLYSEEKNKLVEDEKLLYFLLTTNELNIILEKLPEEYKDIKNVYFEEDTKITLLSVFCELKNKSRKKIAENLKISSQEAKDILEIYLKFLKETIVEEK